MRYEEEYQFCSLYIQIYIYIEWAKLVFFFYITYYNMNKPVNSRQHSYAVLEVILDIVKFRVQTMFSSGVVKNRMTDWTTCTRTVMDSYLSVYYRKVSAPHLWAFWKYSSTDSAILNQYSGFLQTIGVYMSFLFYWTTLLTGIKRFCSYNCLITINDFEVKACQIDTKSQKLSY